MQHSASVARRWAKLKKGKPQATKHVTYNPRLLLTWSVLRAVRSISAVNAGASLLPQSYRARTSATGRIALVGLPDQQTPFEPYILL